MLDTTRGTDQTAGEIRRKIVRGAVSLPVQAMRDHLVRNLPANDKKAEARAIFDFAEKAIRYTDNPPNFDSVKGAGFVISEYLEGRRTPANCTTQTALVGALARSLNIPVRLKVIGDLSPARRFGHVYPELQLNGKWTPADVTAATSGLEYFMARSGLGYSAGADMVKTYSVRGLGMLVREKRLGQIPGRRKLRIGQFRGRRRLGQAEPKTVEEEAAAGAAAGSFLGPVGAIIGAAIAPVKAIMGAVGLASAARDARTGFQDQVVKWNEASKAFKKETAQFTGQSMTDRDYQTFGKMAFDIWGGIIPAAEGYLATA